MIIRLCRSDYLTRFNFKLSRDFKVAKKRYVYCCNALSIPFAIHDTYTAPNTYFGFEIPMNRSYWFFI